MIPSGVDISCVYQEQCLSPKKADRSVEEQMLPWRLPPAQSVIPVQLVFWNWAPTRVCLRSIWDSSGRLTHEDHKFEAISSYTVSWKTVSATLHGTVSIETALSTKHVMELNWLGWDWEGLCEFMKSINDVANWFMPVIPVLEKPRQEGCCSLRLAWATE